MEGGNVLLGNSATPANNHLEAIRCLEKVNLGESEVIVPLSYGDSAYAKVVSWYGRRRLGKAFVPLQDFYPLDEYSKILDSCHVVVMNHYRQQGMGNILATLWRGAKSTRRRRPSEPFPSWIMTRGWKRSSRLEADGPER